MAEYIEREARLIEIDKAFDEYGRGRIDILHLYSECRASIICAPTADVVEVRHGEWLAELVDVMGGVKLLAGLERIKHTCSACGFAHKTPVPWRLAWNYCPNCGAKMDGKGDG